MLEANRKKYNQIKLDRNGDILLEEATLNLKQEKIVSIGISL